ncbi:hypothetical protein BBW65_01090 [Helicobacter enhydrae]|uniref:YhcH/YjgK/YiaL family protein n=1 Tax=Helicobacter enhydrae TaxID=222136 RepID=A0A1B1U406_9HELI|nr:YhcH/YjgK/YiaL family protein [Helicobacter enhydrae]ANV97493.1 hypothetical protein BBW65_01090 [Helicobacter enhydrae]
MAIIGDIETLHHLFGKTIELESLHCAILNICNPNHPLNQKLLSLKKGEQFKEDLDHGIFVIGHCYQLKSEPFFESHQEYFDFQIVIKGYEHFLFGLPKNFQEKIPYDSSKDLIVWESQTAAYNQVKLCANDMIIFAPYDIHSAGFGTGEETQESVYKVIFKVPTKYIKHKL